MSEITNVAVEPLDLPLSEPFEISLGTQYEASNVLVTIETADGVMGYGEGAPVPTVTGETQGAALFTADTMADLIIGEDTVHYRRLVNKIRSAFPGMAAAAFAVETAILDVYCRERDIALSELFGGPPTSVETDLTIPIVDVDTARASATNAAADGFDHLKIKTGNDVHEDVERVVAIHESAPDVHLKVDANQGWTPKETAWFAKEVEKRDVHLDLIEQPVLKDDVAGLARIRDRVDTPVAADEAVFNSEDAIEVVRRNAADIINVKLGKAGVLQVADIVSIAKAANLELMLGCMLESAIGIHTSAHVVAGTGAFSYVDLDGNLLLADDVAEVDHGPTIDIDGPGHGITPE
ncbi:L-alanine-DL-glutamate epimerase [Haladaptatus litoreus]|uniref:L-alanine-DL-glutamate epimerase n=1 Tax=Haladaptatus litoreus TaxID=553468 RepID=A0A1N7EIS6_9EURY|nr:dipeptide epimerase [Haladaptatus litoreus]SIR87875.1 L-alanine-DL-glutamate epimerase [Haladaptatus litoreus]